MNHVNPAQHPTLNQLLQVKTAGLEVFPVSGHQQHAVSPASFHHSRGLFGGGSQRFLAQHVFTGLRCPHRERLMQAVRSRHKNGVHFRILQARRILFVAVVRVGFEFARHPRGLILISTDHCREFCVLALREARQHKSLRDRTQAHHREPNLFPHTHRLEVSQELAATAR